MDCSTKGIIIQGAFSICKCSQVSPKMKEILCKALTKSTLGALCCAWLGSCLALRHSAAGSPGMPGPSADPVLSSFLLKGPLCKMELSPICQGCRQGKFLVPAGGDEPARAFVESLHARLLDDVWTRVSSFSIHAEKTAWQYCSATGEEAKLTLLN